MARSLGKTPYETQLQAAWLIVQGRFVEMATGEGKTLAIALAAAVGGAGRHAGARGHGQRLPGAARAATACAPSTTRLGLRVGS